MNNLHFATVRNFLKKNDFKVGSFGANGRISGMRQFFGGNISVRKNFVSLEVSNVIVSAHNHTWHGDADMNSIAKICKANGWKVTKQGDDIIVDNK